jgi:hypothetical protein
MIPEEKGVLVRRVALRAESRGPKSVARGGSMATQASLAWAVLGTHGYAAPDEGGERRWIVHVDLAVIHYLPNLTV